MRFRVITPDEGWGTREWVQRGVLTTVIVPILVAVVLTAAVDLRHVPGVFVIGLLVILAGMIVRLLKDCRHAASWWIAASAGAYVGLLVYIPVSLLLPFNLTITDHRLDVVLLGLLWTLFYSGVHVFVWQVLRMFYGPVVVQDGTLCPGCGYSLLGAPDQVCSECGRKFTVEELGIDDQEFESRRTTLTTMASPPASGSVESPSQVGSNGED